MATGALAFTPAGRLASCQTRSAPQPVTRLLGYAVSFAGRGMTNDPCSARGFEISGASENSDATTPVGPLIRTAVSNAPNRTKNQANATRERFIRRVSVRCGILALLRPARIS